MPIDIEKDDVKTALKKLKAREDSFKQLEKINNLGSWEVDLITHKSIWSENSYHLYGYEPFSVETTLELFLSHLLPEDVPRVKLAIQELISSHTTQTFQGQIKTKTGEMKDILLNAQALYNEDGVAIKLIGTTQDITGRVILEQRSKELSEIIENSANEIYILDWKTDKYLYANSTACDSLGYTKNEFLELTVFDINKRITKAKAQELKEQYENTTVPYIMIQTIHTRKDGTIYHVQSNLQQMYYNSKKVYVIFATDVTQNLLVSELVDKQAKLLQYQANHDALTELPNRTQFQQKLIDTINNAKKHNTEFALLFLDIDHFKDINDSLGHHIGDIVLKEFALRLKKSIRNNDILARLGGDEFTIIINNIKNISNISAIANKILKTTKKPIVVESKELHITTSIGIVMYPEHTQNKNDLIKFADSAMYKAKKDGRNRYKFYSQNMSIIANKRITLENSLRVAIQEEQFNVYYQPQINTHNKQLLGMEALVRWKHPKLGIISPMDFIPLAEELGLIVAIDRIVMHQAMKQFSKWYKEKKEPGKLSLNLAMAQLLQEDFYSFLFKTMRLYNFKKEWLTLEVTETQVMTNPELSIKKLQQLHDNGIDISIDDFGTGYSSLAYLKKLPLSKLKIDKSFIDDIPNDDDSSAIVKAIIALAKSLDLGLVAEGVETQQQREFLLTNRCDCIQGYLYSKPLPANEMTNYLENF